jgi:hypothetical protein
VGVAKVALALGFRLLAFGLNQPHYWNDYRTLLNHQSSPTTKLRAKSYLPLPHERIKDFLLLEMQVAVKSDGPLVPFRHGQR